MPSRVRQDLYCFTYFHSKEELVMDPTERSQKADTGRVKSIFKTGIRLFLTGSKTVPAFGLLS